MTEQLIPAIEIIIVILLVIVVVIVIAIAISYSHSQSNQNRNREALPMLPGRQAPSESSSETALGKSFKQD